MSFANYRRYWPVVPNDKTSQSKTCAPGREFKTLLTHLAPIILTIKVTS